MTAAPSDSRPDAGTNPYQSFDDVPGAGATAGAGEPARDPFTLDTDTRGERRFRWLAILVGYGSDYLLTEALDRIWWTYVAGRVASGLMEAPSETVSLLVLSLLGSSSSVVGGFVCGLLAKRAELRHGVIQLVLGFVIFVLQVWTSEGPALPRWYYVLTIPAVSAATVGGAWLAQRRRLRRERGAR